jgi:SAM-dependent methyltransferase
MNDHRNKTTSQPHNVSIFTDLHVLNEATRYRRWLFSLIQPHLGQHILEVGSGIGNYTDMLLDKKCVVATDIDETYVRILLERFRNNSNVQVSQLDLNNLDHNLMLKLQDYHLDTIINMNVLEHIKDDLEALKAMKEILSGGGRIITIVPAFPKLFGSLDEAYGHYKRYSKEDFINISQALGLSLVYFRYFNFIGILGWIYSSKIRRKKTLSKQSVAVFDRWVVPTISVIEKKLTLPFGLSLIAVLQK